jgi:DNA-binding transcriptional MerR regulator
MQTNTPEDTSFGHPPMMPVPAKRYFTIGEVSELCGVKPHVLRYWEQEFTQLRPVKRRGNRRYYQHHEVMLVRRIRELLYEEGFTISGARNRLSGVALEEHQIQEETRTLRDTIHTMEQQFLDLRGELVALRHFLQTGQDAHAR